MSMSIGAVVLDNEMMWEDEFSHTPGVGSFDWSIDGKGVIQTFQTYIVRPLTLVSDQNHGWQQRSTVIALQTLAESPATVYTVDLNGRIFQAMFRNEAPPVITFNPVAVATDPLDDFWYYGTIRMRIVS